MADERVIPQNRVAALRSVEHKDPQGEQYAAEQGEYEKR